MSDVTSNLSRVLQNLDSTAADNRDLALKVFSGSVLEAYRAATVFWDNTGNVIAKKTLNGGHMAQWPVIGDDIDLEAIATFADASPAGDYSDPAADVQPLGGLEMGYHSPGRFIEGQRVKMTEQTVRVDDTLVCAIDVPFQDLDLSHFDVMRPFATKIGRSLATSLDKKIATIACKAGAGLDGYGAAVTGVHAGGNSVIREVAISGTDGATIDEIYPDATTGAADFREDCAKLAERMDLDNVPSNGRYLFISPTIRRILRKETAIFNRDFNPEAVAGSLNDRIIGKLEGFNVVLTNHLPNGDTQKKFKGVNSNLEKYDYKFDGTGDTAPVIAALAMCGAQEGSAAVGMVQAGGIRSVLEDDHRRGLKFMKSSMMVGFDVLSPWCAGVIGGYDSTPSA